MAYIATKATYIGEEEVKDENGKPVVDDNGNPVKKIKTDVDDVIFTTGEVIVLIEEVNKGQHFDLSIEDKGSTYFAPTQIKIGDGMHSFKELNWLQTIDYNQVRNSIDKSVEEHTTNLSKAYTQFKQEVNTKIELQNQRISTFIDVDSKEILKNLIQDNYFSLSSNGVLSAFYDNSVSTANNLKSFSIGSSNSFNNSATGQIGRDCIAFGTKNNTFGFNNYSFGYNNNISGAYILTHGYQNTVTTNEKNKWTVCFGYKNEIKNVNNNMVIGNNNSVENSNSFVFGGNNTASNGYSMTMGFKNTASGKYSVAIGANNNASDYYSVAMGYYNTSSAHGSVAMGFGNTSSAHGSVAIGDNNTASNHCSVAIGDNNTASNHCSIAMGHYNTASGEYSVSIGTGLIAVGDYQTTLGKFNIDETELDIRNLFVLGNGTGATNRSNAMTIDWSGNLSLSGGITNLNSGNNLSGENGTHGLIAMGYRNTASASYSAAIGANNTASGQYSVTMGYQNAVSGMYAATIGLSNTSSYACAIAMGQNNTSSGHCSVAMGCDNNAEKDYSIAIGRENTASNHHSVTIGRGNTASGECSISIGKGLIAAGDTQTALGRFNVDETEFDMRNLFVLGNGTDATNRSNAMSVDVAGNLSMNQDVVANAFGDSPISLVELSNRIGIVEEKLAKLVTPEGSK